MHSPIRTSSQSDGWIDVGTEFAAGRHTRSRSPQLNNDNISSVQLANAHSNKAAVAQTEQSMGYNANSLSTATALHQAESNGSSTETGGTDNTMTDIHATSSPSLLGVRAICPTAALTKSNMEQHQRELAQFRTDSVSGWVHGAGIGDRLTRGLAPSAPRSMMANSMPSMGSTVASQDWQHVQLVQPPMHTDDQVTDAGAWCDDLIGPAVYTLSGISLNSE
ncbi:hypothetical protein MFIFM68171_00571 [Madurella fahalii]|uniref:Uncharacterized protein n=1 Tax=Madurella fahalii TaxID=1157608 RepID=A0ABQ0FXX9_9PEZI